MVFCGLFCFFLPIYHVYKILVNILYQIPVDDSIRQKMSGGNAMKTKKLKKFQLFLKKVSKMSNRHRLIISEGFFSFNFLNGGELE